MIEVMADSGRRRLVRAVVVALLVGLCCPSSRADERQQQPRVTQEPSGVCVAELRPAARSSSNGSGSATLRIASDEKSAVLSLQHTNLSSAPTAIHIERAGTSGEARSVLFDVAAAKPEPNGTYVWRFTADESQPDQQIVSAIKAGRTALTIQTATHPAGEISGFFKLSRAGQAAVVPTPPPALPTGTPSATDASRLLSQATFGGNEELIRQVQKVGVHEFLRQQIREPASSHVQLVAASDARTRRLRLMDAWWTHAISAPDQLRQRVTFALSQILVVSVRTNGLVNRPFAIAEYVDLLGRNAFGNYRQLLEEVTLSPAMGLYLNMVHNAKADPAKGTHPNENYARELLQLFSTGVYRLNVDGSLQLDANGFPIPVYDQRAVMGLAAAFTGWNFAHRGPPRWEGVEPNFRQPMRAVPDQHEPAEKIILDGVVLPANQTPQQDLKQALDTVFNHPNVGPFVCRQLIQRLVTSNPSPGYVYRVASVFNDNGKGVRGDLGAVVQAILTDYDARTVEKNTRTAGHLREPVLRLTNLLRAFHASTPSGTFRIVQPGPLGQVPLHSPTVFNFFSPDYQLPGEIAESGLSSPELQILTETTAITSANFLQRAVFDFIGPADNKITLDLKREEALAVDAAKLVDHLDMVLMSSSMSVRMRKLLTNAIQKIPSSDRAARARTAIYLVINSPEYVVQK